MVKIEDKYSTPYIKQLMRYRCVQPDGMTFDDDFDYYLQTDHSNYFTEDGKCFICVAVHDTYVSVPYIYSDMTFKHHRELVRFAKCLYKRYTIRDNKPMLYTGVKNYYPNHSVEVYDNVWQFIPKD